MSSSKRANKRSYPNIYEEVIHRGEFETVSFQMHASKDSSPHITMKFEDTFLRIPISNNKCTYEEFIALVDAEAEKYYCNRIMVFQAQLDYYLNKSRKLASKRFKYNHV